MSKTTPSQAAGQLLQRMTPAHALGRLATWAAANGYTDDPQIQALRRQLLAAMDVPPITRDMAPPQVAAVLQRALGTEGACAWCEQAAQDLGRWTPNNRAVYQLLTARKGAQPR